jgi:hypothetical protein
MPQHQSDDAELRPARPIDDRPGKAELPAGVVAARQAADAEAIAYAHALVDLSAQGHVDSALPVSRTLHEALGVLEVVNDEAVQTILDRWLEDREVQPNKVRAAAERQAKRVAEEASTQGIDSR